MTAPTSLQIPSEGYTLDADLYLPAAGKSQGKQPQIIVLGHGIGALKSMGLDVFAKHFASLGLAALTFDYRGFGKSTGALREYVNAYDHITDWNNVLQYIRDGNVKEVDSKRISIWGSSFGGGQVLAVASEPRNADLKAVVSQVPFPGTWEAITRIPPTALLQLVPRSIVDKLGSYLGRPPLRIQLAGKPGEVAIMTAPDALDGFYELAPHGKKDWTLGGYVPARFFVEHLFYQPMWNAANIKAPTLIVGAEGDIVCPLWALKRNARPIPCLQLEVLNCGHFEVYGGRKYHKQNLDLQTDFLKRTLGL